MMVLIAINLISQYINQLTNQLTEHIIKTLVHIANHLILLYLIAISAIQKISIGLFP